MPQQQPQSLFLGVTESPMREWTARLAIESERPVVWVPCVGRFAIVEVMCRYGIAPDRIIASDITLFSSLIGYLADPNRSVHDLNMKWDTQYDVFVDGAEDDLAYAAGSLVLMRYLQLGVNSYTRDQQRELKRSAKHYRSRVGEKLKSMMDVIGGLTYRCADVFDEFDAAINRDDSYLDVSPSWYKGGYSKMFQPIEDAITWDNPNFNEMTLESVIGMFQRAVGAPLRMTADIPPDQFTLPDGWHRVALSRPNDDTADYVVANWNPGWTMAHISKKPAPPRPKAVYDGATITPDSVIGFKPVDAATSNYYRDLFGHDGPSGGGDFNALFLIDGRIAGVTAFLIGDVASGRTDAAVETSAVTRGNDPTLNRLMDAALATKEFRSLMEVSKRGFYIRTMRSYLDLDGHAVPFVDATYQDALAHWLTGRLTEKV